MTDHRFLLCTDMDRTIIPNGRETETPGCRRRLTQFLLQSESQLAYVTGRHKALVQQAMQEYQLPRANYVISNVGSQILQPQEEDWPELADWNQQMEQDWAGIDAHTITLRLRDIPQLVLQEPEKQSPHKISFYVNPANQLSQVQTQVQQELAQIPIAANVICSIDEDKAVGLLDLLPKSASKLHALEFLMAYLQLGKHQILFAGDSGNDMAVLQSDIPAVLVANASAEVREQAVQGAHKNGTQDRLYLAQGQYLDSNGNYAAGILEGIWHYQPGFRQLISQLT